MASPGENITIRMCAGDGDSGELVGLAESAGILGVDRPGIARWRRNGRMPPLVADLRAGPVWRREDVEALADERARRAADRAAALA